MKRFFIIFITCFFSFSAFTQTKKTCADFSYLNKETVADLGIVLYSNDAETAWNALRLANFARTNGDKVIIFLLGKGVDGFQIQDNKFDIQTESLNFVSGGGQVLACATCVTLRGTEDVAKCTVSSMKDLYHIISTSKRIVTF